MLKLDDNFLNELGLGALPPTEKNKMLAHIYETLEMRVGMRLAEKMTNEQLDEFEAYINKNDEAGALKWLETNFPNYKEVVAEELEKLKAEIKQVAPQIVAQAQQNVANGASVAEASIAPQPAPPTTPQTSYPAQQPGNQPQYPPASTAIPQQYGYPTQNAPDTPTPVQPQPATNYQQPVVPDPVAQNPALYPQQPNYPPATPATNPYQPPASTTLSTSPVSPPSNMTPPQIHFQQPQTPDQNQPYNPPATNQPYMPPTQPQNPSQPL